MGWFIKLEHKGKDLYPLLMANFEKPEYYVNEKVRGEVMRHLLKTFRTAVVLKYPPTWTVLDFTPRAWAICLPSVPR